VTKPAALLGRANRALADQTNEQAVIDVTNFIQPVVDVFALDNDLFVLSFDYTMIAALKPRFKWGPVPRAEIWDVQEFALDDKAGGPFGYEARLVFDGGPLADRHLTITKGGAANQAPMNILRSFQDTGNTPPSYGSDRPLQMYPGMFLEIKGLTNHAIGDIICLNATYKKRVANEPGFGVNNNANIAVVEV